MSTSSLPSPIPSVFVSHGAPSLAVEDGPTHRFLKSYGGALGVPTAILVVSAHWETDAPRASTVGRPETIHDFYGFPDELYQIRYSADGAPELSTRVAELLARQGLDATLDPGRGLDHGAWVPLTLMYPRADIPVAQLSVQPGRGPRHHLRVGQALAPLRDEGVLILGSGAMTHNLSRLERGRGNDVPPDWVSEFSDWVVFTIQEGRVDDLVEYRARSPRRPKPSDRGTFIAPVRRLGRGRSAVPGATGPRQF